MNSSARPRVGLVVPPDVAPGDILRAAHAAQDAHLDELWFWEDCFATSGLAPAVAVLAATDLTVGIGLMPVPLRAPSLTAMEIATVAGMFPGRLRPALGHGVQEWMAQAGVRVSSPVTLLREHVESVTRLLAGDEVSVEGRYVRLAAVQLRWPPGEAPGVLVGGRGPRTLAVAGELAAGVLLDDVAPRGAVDAARVAEALGTVRDAWHRAGRDGEPQTVGLLPVADDVDAARLRERIDRLGELGIGTVMVLAGGAGAPPAGDERVPAMAGRIRDALDR